MNRAETSAMDLRVMNGLAVVLFAVFVGSVLLAVTRWVSNRSVFALHSITVVGDVAHANAPTVRAHVVSRVTGSFFSVDLARTRTVLEAMPWVRHAVVHRDFPNKLRVQLQEHQVAAYWGDANEPRLLNTFGEVFDANVGEVEADDLPHLNGPLEQSTKVLAAYRALAPQFSAMDLTLDSLELTNQGSWRIGLAGGAVIEAGRGDLEQIQTDVAQFLKTLTRVLARYQRPAGALESADLRYKNGYAIRLRGVSTLAAVAPTP
ncbi:MAG: cell division protein FtsQ/DivIB [Rhodoferax sp.]